MAANQPVVSQEEGVWVLRLESGDGRVQEYRCATEGQARKLALVLSASGGAAPGGAASGGTPPKDTAR